MGQIDTVTWDFILRHRASDTDIRQLALQASRYPEVDMQEALVQISGWRIALRKLPSWTAIEGILYPSHLSMEQCSSEQTARYKAGLVSSVNYPQGMTSMVDLTGGLGVDFSFLARSFMKAIYVERQPVLCEKARHNFPLLGLNRIEIVEAETEIYLRNMEPVDWIYLDPARRDEKGGKVVRIMDCSPDVGALLELLRKKADRILVKFSPMLDLAQIYRELPGVIETVHVVAVNGECKEVLVVICGSAFGTEQREFHTVDLCSDGIQRFSFMKEEEEAAVCEYADKPLTYLYEPNAAVLKAGAYRLLAVRFGLKKLHPDSHLYTSDTWCETFPGRSFWVQGFSGFGKNKLKQLLDGLEKANLTVRGFPSTVAELRKKLSLKEGGETYLFAATVGKGTKVLIRCIKNK